MVQAVNSPAETEYMGNKLEEYVNPIRATERRGVIYDPLP